MKKKIEQMAQTQAVAAANPNVTPESLGLEPPQEEIREEQKMAVARVKLKEIMPDKRTLWKVIFAIVGFLGLVSLLFYILWWTQAKADQNAAVESLPPQG